MHTFVPVIVPVIILTIIGLQIFFFMKNLRRMSQFSEVFSDDTSWKIHKNLVTNFVDGIMGSGNVIFASIMNSINKYLRNNSGSVIDFGLLKDAVDRHCDSVENEISTQTPLPLYLGLAGTMAGVIVGLWDLLDSNAIITLMGSAGGGIDASSKSAAYGINSLLSGVAWAMSASIVGIIFTTINSIQFKKCKLKEESGKNSFLAWMQSRLLPELPSDTSDALNNLVVNLNSFNQTFASNTSSLRDALSEVNESYAIQAEIIKAVHDMDVMKMANVNIRVLHELQECTDKLEVFNQYLSEVEGYTEAIHRFENQFEEQSQRLHVLEEIRDFFARHKGEIARTTADADKELQKALTDIREKSESNVGQLHDYFVVQSNIFKNILTEEKESFERYSSELNANFSAQLSRMPQLAKQLEQISAIPSHLDKLLEKIDKSNKRLASDISAALAHVGSESNYGYDLKTTGGDGSSVAPVSGWVKWTVVSALVVIALGVIFNVVTYFISPDRSEQIVAPSEESAGLLEPSLGLDTVSLDTHNIINENESASQVENGMQSAKGNVHSQRPVSAASAGKVNNLAPVQENQTPQSATHQRSVSNNTQGSVGLDAKR